MAEGGAAVGHILDVQIASKWWQDQAARRPALANVSMSIRSRESIAILGKSGIGKSTLLKVIAGVDSLFEGTVLVDSKPVAVGNGDVGLVYQQNRIFDYLTALENVEFAYSERGPASRRAALEWLDKVGLTDRADAFPKDLSEGEKKRVAIARGLVRPPKFLLLDEPLSGLDTPTGERIAQDLKALQDEHGFGCVITTHDPLEAIALSERALFLDGSPATLARELDLKSARSDPQRHAEMITALQRALAKK